MKKFGLATYTWLQARLQRVQSEDERGQGAVEYAAIVAVVAVAVAALAPDTITGVMSAAVTTMGTVVDGAIGGIGA